MCHSPGGRRFPVGRARRPRMKPGSGRYRDTCADGQDLERLPYMVGGIREGAFDGFPALCWKWVHPSWRDSAAVVTPAIIVLTRPRRQQRSPADAA